MTTETPADPSTPTEPITLATLADSDYNSDEDSDFNPEAATAAAGNSDDGGDSSSSEEEDGGSGGDSAGGRKRRKAVKGSGGKKRRRKDDDFADGELDEEGGEGGLVKTRAQREREKLEEKQFKISTEITEDKSIDSIWESLQKDSAPWKKPTTTTYTTETTTETTSPSATDADKEQKDDRPLSFAGELLPTPSTSTSTPLSTLPTLTSASTSNNGTTKPHLRRPKKRASAFDTAPPPVRARKLNTLEKSKMDWEGFVAKEGIKEELVAHGKGGKGYVDRQEFLGRSDLKVWERVKGGSKAGGGAGSGS